MSDERVLYTWVHLSDIHFGHGAADHRWDQALVLSRLKKDIELASQRNIPKPQAIFITGDIAFSGSVKVRPPDSISREYESAAIYLNDIADSVRLTPRDIFMVPGNHDVQRDVAAKDRSTFRLLERLRSGSESLDDALADPSDRLLLTSRLKNYLKFAASFSPAMGTQDKLYWNYSIVTQELRIRVLGLNTAILAADDKDKGHLRLGKEQLQSHLGTSAVGEGAPSEVTIALSHHPFDWLSDERDVSGWINSSCHIHLYGHVHEASSERSYKGGGTHIVRVGAGAVHGEAGEPVGHGYSIAAIVADAEGHVCLRTWPRKWSDSVKDFRLDPNNVPDGAFFVDHPLPTRVSPATNVRASVSPVEIPDYLVESGEEAPESRPSALDLRLPDSDSPPTTPAWVGRETELDLLLDDDVKVVAITGIGGQGKSCLAAKFLETSMGAERYSFWDWRDCREEGDTLQTHIIRIIERLTGGTTPGVGLADETASSLVRILFQVLGDRRGVFIFDNVDHYIDVESNWPVRGLQVLVDTALKSRHSSRFIFTCRPSVVSDNPLFFQVGLSGLSVTETQKLFELRGVDLTSSQMRRGVSDAQSITQGHPLWLNLIATQVAKNKANIDRMVADIRRGKGAVLPATMLRSIWKTLNENQREILRCMAESVRPETVEQIARYLEGEMNWNRFNRALRSLKALNLIVEKNAPNARDALELHPLLRDFIASEFPQKERRKYIDLITKVFDSVIVRLRSNIGAGASFSVLENWVLRAELALNAKQYGEAFDSLNDIATPLLAEGYAEEFVRVSGRLFSDIDWRDVTLEVYPKFDGVFSHFVKVLSQMGRYDDADYYLRRYEETIVGKSARYVSLCSDRCYFYWNRGDYVLAKDWGRRGHELKLSSGIDTHHECSTNLALALRDSDEIEAALTIFLNGRDLDVILSDNAADADEGLNSSIYGNVGRCLWLSGNAVGALIAYKRSARKLQVESSAVTAFNRGWANLWIGEAMEALQEVDLAYCFYRHAQRLWSSISPTKAEKCVERAAALVAKYSVELTMLSASDIEIENRCRRWIES